MISTFGQTNKTLQQEFPVPNFRPLDDGVTRCNVIYQIPCARHALGATLAKQRVLSAPEEENILGTQNSMPKDPMLDLQNMHGLVKTPTLKILR